MSDLLSSIKLVSRPSSHSKIKDSSSTANHESNLNLVTQSSHAITNAHVVSETPLQTPLDLEDGRLKQGPIIVVIIIVLTGVNFLSSLSNGFITVGLPRIASDLSLPGHLMVWPTAVNYLTCSSCLLLAGSIADVIGARRINLTGCLLSGVFVIACGFARTGIEFIMFRAMQGIAISLCLPTSVALVSAAAPRGRKRNFGFACLGFVQPIGFSMGMVLEGFILDTVGWRFSYYLCGGLSLALFGVGIWALPHDPLIEGSIITKLNKDIDWVGALIASTCLAILSYVLVTLTSDISNIRKSTSITLLVLSAALIPVFILWEGRRERLSFPALIPNSLWTNSAFTSICLTVLFCNAVVGAMEVYCSLFFQEIQYTSALGASLRILPSLLVGFIVQLAIGLIIHRTSPYLLVLIALLLSAGAPILMALISARWPYWYAAFPAQLLSPLACDVLFPIGLLAVSEGFPSHTQALAGAVFNTLAQFGMSFGLTVMALVAAAVTKGEEGQGKGKREELLAGYRAAFWTAFVLSGLACLIGAFGLRRMGKVGLKVD